MSTSTLPVLAQSIPAHSIVVARHAASVSLVEVLAAQLRVAALEEAQEVIDGARPAIARYETEKDILPAAIIVMEAGVFSTWPPTSRRGCSSWTTTPKGRRRTN